MLLSNYKPSDGTAPVKSSPADTGLGYVLLSEAVKKTFAEIPASTQLYRTNVSGLANVYLNAIPDNIRQHYNCNACRSFLSNYGGLVYIAEGKDGIKMVSAIWPDAPFVWPSPIHGELFQGDFAKVCMALRGEVLRADITSPFYPTSALLGHESNDGWNHLCVSCEGRKVYTSTEASAKVGDVLSVKRMLMENVCGNFTADQVESAINQLVARGFTYGVHSQTINNLRWIKAFLEGEAAVRRISPRKRLLYIWDAAASAPAGYANVKTTMAGNYLRLSSLGSSSALATYIKESDPTKYRMAIAPPSQGLVDEGEKYFDDNNLRRSLPRRIALASEIPPTWRPLAPIPIDATKRINSSVFGPMSVRGDGRNKTPTIIGNITWKLFEKTVLSRATRITYRIANAVNFAALTTSANRDAKPLFAWDNSTSWFTYESPVSPSIWGLQAEQVVDVSRICNPPYAALCDKNPAVFNRYGERVFILLEGPQSMGRPGPAIFERHLKSDIAKYGRVVTEYCRNNQMSESPHGQQAIGIMLTQARFSPEPITVWIGNEPYSYVIDRWE